MGFPYHLSPPRANFTHAMITNEHKNRFIRPRFNKMRDDLATHDGWAALQLQLVQSVLPECVDMRKMPPAHTPTPIFSLVSRRMCGTRMQSSNRVIIQRPMAAWEWVRGCDTGADKPRRPNLLEMNCISLVTSNRSVTLRLVRHEKQATFDGYISGALSSLRAPALFIAALFSPCVNLSAPHPHPASEPPPPPAADLSAGPR